MDGLNLMVKIRHDVGEIRSFQKWGPDIFQNILELVHEGPRTRRGGAWLGRHGLPSDGGLTVAVGSPSAIFDSILDPFSPPRSSGGLEITLVRHCTLRRLVFEGEEFLNRSSEHHIWEERLPAEPVGVVPNARGALHELANQPLRLKTFPTGLAPPKMGQFLEPDADLAPAPGQMTSKRIRIP